MKIKKYLLAALVAASLFNSLPPAEAWVKTDSFGWRIHPVTGEYKFHSGVDLGEEAGTPIGSWIAGTVVFADQWGGYGNTVIVKRDDSFYMLFGHCAQLTVSPGQAVEYGQMIATVGSTGISTGPHVHVEVWQNGQYIDPLAIFSFGE